MPFLQNVLPEVGKQRRNKKQFIKKTVQSKSSIGHIKFSFNEPAERFYRTPKTFSVNFRRKTWIFSEEKNNPTQNFSVTQHFLTKFRNIFHQYSENCKSFSFKNQIFQEKLLYTKIAVLTSFLEIQRQNARIFSFFFKKFFLQISNSGQNFFAHTNCS